MTVLYQYVIRYYNVRRKKHYITITSPYFAFDDICSDSMRETIRTILSNDNYKIELQKMAVQLSMCQDNQKQIALKTIDFMLSEFIAANH